MPTIKNVCAHQEDLHDGRTLPAYATAEITTEELELPHYQTRISSGLFLLVEEPAGPEKPKPAVRRAPKKEDQ